MATVRATRPTTGCRRHLDLEAALIWAFRDQMAGGPIEEQRWLEGGALSPLARALRVLELGGHIQGGGGGFRCHEDALALAALVSGCAAPGLVRYQAMLGERPAWDAGAPRAMRAAWSEGARAWCWRRGLEDERAACPVQFLGTAERHLELRQVWRRWRAALAELEEGALALNGRLRSVVVVPGLPPATPWADAVLLSRARTLGASQATPSDRSLVTALARAGLRPREIAARLGMEVDAARKLVRSARRREAATGGSAGVSHYA